MRAPQFVSDAANQDSRPLVVALHCSGGTAGQWRLLGDRLGSRYAFLAPNLHGAPGGPVWAGDRPFRLADEAEPILRAIDRHDGPVHLVGHSYGGALALHMALQRPDRFASLAVYEPSAFYLLRFFGPEGKRALRQINFLAASMKRKFARGEWRDAAARFLDYWNGAGAWGAMRPELQAEMISYLPKAQLDFHALTRESAPRTGLGRLQCPVRLLCGEHAPYPTRLIAEQLAVRLPGADLLTISGAGHMGPLTHPEAVAHGIAAHIHLASEGLYDKRAA